MWNSFWPIGLLFALTGCGGFAALNTPEEPTDASAEGELSTGAFDPTLLRIDAITPDHAIADAGQEIVIEGGPFTAGTEVWIAGEKVELVQVMQDRLVVIAPELDEEGAADVVIIAGDQAIEKKEGMAFWFDAAGLVAVRGTVGIGSYLESAGEGEDFAYANITLIRPMAYEPWQAWSDSFGGCSADYAFTPDDEADTSASDSVSLSIGDQHMPLAHEEDWFSVDAGSDDHRPGESLDLELGGGIWPTIEMPELVELPTAFEILSPAMNEASRPRVDRDLQFRWDMTEPGDFVSILLQRSFVDPDTGDAVVDQVVTCAVPDSGSFTVPPAIWNGWYAGDNITVSFGRNHVSDGVLPHNGASTAITGTHWLIGEVRTQ